MNRDDAFMAVPPTDTPRRGGRRPGAGRPPAYTEPLVRKTVALPKSYAAQLAAFGQGNLSEGIRRLVEFAYTSTGRPWFTPTTPAAGRPDPGRTPPR